MHDIGRLPTGWRPLVTNGDPANTTWQVVEDATAPGGSVCLALLRNASGRSQCNLCVSPSSAPADVEVSAYCQGDDGVGVVWRCQDAGHYYVCRVNPMEGNFGLFKVVGGRRTRLADARLGRFEDNRWYEIRAAMRGAQITCSLDGKPLIESADRSIVEAGGVGVWTRADALGRFAGFAARATANY